MTHRILLIFNKIKLKHLQLTPTISKTDTIIVTEIKFSTIIIHFVNI